MDTLKKLANTLLVNAPRKEDGFMAYRLDGSGRGHSKKLATATYFLARFQPELCKLFNSLKWEALFLELVAE